MWLKSTAAPATVNEDKPCNATHKMRKGKGRKIHKSGDLPKSFRLGAFGGKCKSKI